MSLLSTDDSVVHRSLRRQVPSRPEWGDSPGGRSLDVLRARHPRSEWCADEAFLIDATLTSFRLEGHSIGVAEVAQAIDRHNKHRRFRNRLGQRLRNHAAILLRIERLIGSGESLKPGEVLRWYASLSSGLCTSGLATCKLDRLDAVVRRLNNPHPRVTTFLHEAADLFHACLSDALVPSFNGMLVRCLLHFHLGRGGFRPVRFDANTDPARFDTVEAAHRRIVELIEFGVGH